MSKTFQRMYPPSERITFDGGLNNKYARNIIADNESPDCANVRFGEGSVETRGGSSEINTAAANTQACNGLFVRHDRTGAETMVGFYGTDMFILSGTSWITVPSAQSYYTADVNVCGAEYENHLFFGNGYTIPHKYGGTYFTRHGVYAPTETPTAVSQATGVLSGSYSYKYTYVNSFSAEGDLNGTAVTISVLAGTVRLTSLSVAPTSFGVSARRIYRYDVDGYKRIAEIADNTTTTYDDNTLTVGVTAPSDNGVPPLYSIAIYHQSRLFTNDAENPNLVWYSNVGEPYTFASTNFLAIGDDAGDLVQAFEIFDNSLVVFCKRSVYLIYMESTTETTWRTIKTRINYGCKSPFGIFKYNNKIMFPAMDGDKLVGFAAMRGDTLDPDATLLTVSAAGSDMKSARIETDIFTINDAYAKNIRAITYKNRAYIAVTYGLAETRNNRIYVYDFSISNLKKQQEAAWSPDTGIDPGPFAIYNGDLYFGEASLTGKLVEYETSSYADNGAAIDSYFWTKEYPGYKEDLNSQKDFRVANLFYSNLGDYFMGLRYRMDSDGGVGNSSQISLDPGGSLWGTMVWGSDNWGGNMDDAELQIFLGQSRGKRIQFKFDNKNTVNQGFKVYGLNFGYNLKGIR